MLWTDIDTINMQSNVVAFLSSLIFCYYLVFCVQLLLVKMVMGFSHYLT